MTVAFFFERLPSVYVMYIMHRIQPECFGSSNLHNSLSSKTWKLNSHSYVVNNGLHDSLFRLANNRLGIFAWVFDVKSFTVLDFVYYKYTWAKSWLLDLQKVISIVLYQNITKGLPAFRMVIVIWSFNFLLKETNISAFSNPNPPTS